MSDFHAIFRAVHGELWESCPDQGPALQGLLDALSSEPTPEGVRRLPSSRMTLGPHLAPQMESGADDAVVTWLDTRREAPTATPLHMRL